MKKIAVIFLLSSLFTWYAFKFGGDSSTKCDGEGFDGSARSRAKLSIGTGTVEHMSVATFLNRFSGSPELDDESERSTVEQRNVSVTGWLYTFGREGDEDFHLILGTTNQTAGLKFMSAEISGLPLRASHSFSKLAAARKKFKHLFLNDENYRSGFTHKYLTEPIKVAVTGSVFYDTHHASGGSGTGKYKSHSAWEIHPVTDIQLVQ